MSAQLEVRVSGMDANGKVFHQAVPLLDMSLSGARITGLRSPLNRGDIVGLSSGGDKCRFKVSWSLNNEDGTSLVGLQCLEKGTTPWRDLLQQTTSGDRRRTGRYPCRGSVSLRLAAYSSPIWGTLRDIGAGGCYMQSVNVAAAGEIVSGNFILNGVPVSGIAEVRTSHATRGMGLLWCDLGWDGQEKLDDLLRTLSLSYTDPNSGHGKALAQLEALHDSMSALRERLDRSNTPVDLQLIGLLSETQQKLAGALRSVQS